MEANTSEITVIGIASGKGGVGKSTVAVNLGLAFATLGRRTLLLDADLGLANAQILMGLDAPYDIGDVVSGRKNIKDVVVKGSENFELIPGASGNAALANISPIAASDLIDSVKSELNAVEVLIIDCAAGLAESNLAFLDCCNMKIIVVQDEPASIADCYGVIKIENKKGQMEDIFVLPNRVKSQTEGKALFDKLNSVCMKFLEEPVNYITSILDSQLIAGLNRKRESLFPNHATTPPAKDFTTLATKITELKSLNSVL